MPGDYKFQPQNQFGTIIKQNTFHLFQTKIHNFGYVVSLYYLNKKFKLLKDNLLICVLMDFQGFFFDIYVHKETSEEPPYHVGFTHILPSNMKYSNGVIMCPITSVQQRPIGELKSKYV